MKIQSFHTGDPVPNNAKFLHTQTKHQPAVRTTVKTTREYTIAADNHTHTPQTDVTEETTTESQVQSEGVQEHYFLTDDGAA